MVVELLSCSVLIMVMIMITRIIVAETRPSPALTIYTGGIIDNLEGVIFDRRVFPNQCFVHVVILCHAFVITINLYTVGERVH